MRRTGRPMQTTSHVAVDGDKKSASQQLQRPANGRHGHIPSQPTTNEPFCYPCEPPLDRKAFISILLFFVINYFLLPFPKKRTTTTTKQKKQNLLSSNRVTESVGCISPQLHYILCSRQEVAEHAIDRTKNAHGQTNTVRSGFTFALRKRCVGTERNARKNRKLSVFLHEN